MEDFSITSRISTKEYVKFMFTGLYKKPAFIVGTVLGIYLVATIILDYFTVINFYDSTPYFELCCGLFLLLAPALIVLLSTRQFLFNPSCTNDITYTFSETGFTEQGLTFKAEYVWEHIIKQKVMGQFLVLYHTKKAGNFINKTQLTAEQLAFIKAKVVKK